MSVAARGCRIRLAIPAVAATAAFLAGACGKKPAEVEGVLVPQADGVIEAPEGATLALDVGQVASAQVPRAAVVRLALGRDVPWDQVKALIAKVKAAGARPALLVGRYHWLKAFRLEDEAAPGETAPGETASHPIEVTTYVDGKACIRQPGALEATCVQSIDAKHIDRAYVREFVREVVTQRGIRDVIVDVPDGLSWADVVRVIDGARTCCGETVMRVRIAAPAVELEPER